jgi:hypothetical protein
MPRTDAYPCIRPIIFRRIDSDDRTGVHHRLIYELHDVLSANVTEIDDLNGGPSKFSTRIILRVGNLILGRRPYTCPPPILRCSKLGKVSARLRERDLVRCAPKVLGVVVVLPVIIPSAHRAYFVPAPRSESQHRTAWAGKLLARNRVLTDIDESAHPTAIHRPGLASSTQLDRHRHS